jgi:acyl-CoA reductase-like NAD-dependent aldehyde dehydrogenase
MKAFTVGDPADPKTAIGPMVSQKQYERVQSCIHKGVEEGAEVVAGGEGHPAGLEAGYFVKPTVFANVIGLRGFLRARWRPRRPGRCDLLPGHVHRRRF